MKRRLRPAVELASDIGAKAADLHAHGDAAALEALDFLCKVNPDVYSWLLDRLMAVRSRRRYGPLSSPAPIDGKDSHWALRQCYIMARRSVNVTGNHSPRWENVIRLCELAGCTSEVLRDDENACASEPKKALGEGQS